METEWGRQVAAVAAVLGLLGAALAWLGRRGQLAWRGLPRGRRAGALEIVEGRALRPGVSLHLVRVGNRTLLVAAHAQGCTLVDALPDRDGREEADRCA